MKKIYLKNVLTFVLVLSTTILFSQNKITSFPYTESFESGLGDWVQSADDVFDWSWHTGGTSSTGTGPNAAYDGSYYIYTEASSNFNNDTYLDASFDFSGLSTPVFSFYYHMYGADMGSLHIDIWDGTWNQDVYAISGQQQTDYSSPWKNAIVDLTSFASNDSIVIRLRGITGTNYTSDICIDKIDVYEGSEMSLDTIIVTQPVTDSIYQNTQNNIIALIEINILGEVNPLSVDTFYWNANGTDNFADDVENVSIYYTGNDSSFSTSELYGSTQNLSEPIINNRTLNIGKNYFWVTYDIYETAIINNFIDFECDSISIQGTSGNEIPAITAPIGNRKIVEAPQYYNFMPASIVVGQPDFYTQNTTLDEYTGTGSNNSAISSKGILAVGSQSRGRILIWNHIPDTNGTPADIVLGNPDFYTENNGPTDAYMRNVEGVCFSPDGEKLIASDGNNNRVLIWNSIPTTNAQPADVVIGQIDFTSGSSGIGPDKLYYPGGVMVTPDGKLIITDLNNNRVLVFNQIPTVNGASANLVIGQDDLNSNSAGVGPNKLNGPWYSSVSTDGKLVIADRMNNRILVYNEFPTQNGESADVVIGQDDFYSSTSGVSDRKMTIPIGVTMSPTGKLAIGEYTNNRVLIYNEIPDTNGAPADYVLGQPDFNSNTAFNGGVSEKSMYHPYGINFDLNGRLYVNGRDMHRVMIYGDLPSDTADLNISIAADKTNPHVGESITYTFTLSNNGPNSSSEIVVKSALPGLFKLTGYNVEKGEYQPYGGTWNVPFMASGESVDLILDGTIEDGSGDITAYSNIIASSAIDTNMNNNATSLTINVINEAPTITEFTNDTIDQGTSTDWIPFTINDVDTEMSNIEVIAVSSNQTIVPDVNIQLDGENENRYLKVTPLTDQSGAVDITVTVSDGYNEDQSIFELYILSNNANLIDLDTSGTTITGFRSDSLTYTCELPAGTTTAPTVTALAEHIEAQVNVYETDTLPGITTVEVTAEDGKTVNTYLVTFIFPVNTNNDASLIDLQVEGTTIDGFSPIQYFYTEYLSYGTVIVPSISATPKNGAATIDIRKTLVLPGKDSVVVTATDGVTEQTYVIDYVVNSASDNNNLQKITVNGEEIVTFDPSVLEYTIEYPYGTTVVPTVIAIPEDANAYTDQTDAASMPGTTTIDVYAEDATMKTYTVEFTLALPSDDATLIDLDVDGSTIFGFDSAVYSYDIELDNSITEVPEVTAVATHDSANVVITEATAIPGTTSVVVTAQDGTTELTYNVNFSYEPLSNVSLLSDLKADGITVDGFDPEVYTYTIVLPEGTTTPPTVTATVYDSKASKVIDNTSSIPGTTTVTVTAEDNSTSVYYVNFTYENLNNDATLSDLQVDGTTISGFDPATLIYNIELPYGTSDVPVVTATKNDANADMVITEATSLPGTTTVLVTAEDEVTTNTYEVNFTIADPNTDATLSDLKVDGTTISGFDPATLIYNMELPYGTSNVPVVTATKNDANADMEITDATSLPGTTTVLVTAEDGVTTNTYTINFTIADPATDATLSDLQVDGTTVSGFSASTLSYNMELASGTTIVPTVTATTSDVNADVNITDATALPGTTSVVVTAEDGTTTETYSVNFTVATSVFDLSFERSINLYPNPTNGIINISFDNVINTKWQIEVFNSIGSLVYTEELSKIDKTIHKVDLGNFSRGMYFIKISTNTESCVKNIILK